MLGQVQVRQSQGHQEAFTRGRIFVDQFKAKLRPLGEFLAAKENSQVLGELATLLTRLLGFARFKRAASKRCLMGSYIAICK